MNNKKDSFSDHNDFENTENSNMSPSHGKGTPKKNFFTSTFIAGAFAALPLVVTIYVFKLLYKVISNNLSPSISRLLGDKVEVLPDFLMGLISVLVFILSIFLVGALIKFYIGKVLFNFVEKLFTSIPIAKTIYNLIKQMTESITSSSSNFEKVVVIDFPVEGSYSLGFLIRTTQNQITSVINKEKEYYNVFVPTAPNPMSGFIIIVEKDKCLEVPISIDEGAKFIISVSLIDFNSKEEVKNYIIGENLKK